MLDAVSEIAKRETGADPSETAALVRLWVQGWAAARGVSPPVAHGDGWRIEVGRPQEKRRHVFPRISQSLRAVAESSFEPWSYVKACATAGELRAALPAHWHVEEQTYFMRFEGPPPPAPALASGYGLDIATQGRLVAARVLAADDGVAAAGHAVVVEDAVIFDRISTDAAHRRRGLGRAVMCALDAASRALGARRGLLGATADGYEMYRTLGWRVQSPLVSGVIVGT
jgi:GNAT superfamily N-acetyltransferase